MTPMDLKQMAGELNALREMISHDVDAITQLDGICARVANWADDADKEYGNVFRDHCQIG